MRGVKERGGGGVKDMGGGSEGDGMRITCVVFTQNNTSTALNSFKSSPKEVQLDQ